MKQIISFEKEILFKTMIGEITSISLEHTLKFEDDTSIFGDFLVSGTYKLTEASRLDEPFSYKVPVDIELTSALEEKDRKVAISNFTYEIVDEEALLIKIDLLVEGLEKIEEKEPLEEAPVEVLTVEEKEEIRETPKPSLIEEPKEEEEIQDESLIDDHDKSPLLEENIILEAKENLDKVNPPLEDDKPKETLKESLEPSSKEVMTSIFSVFQNTSETFSTYSIYILREGDTLDEVLNRYNISREEASKYNSLDDLKIGSKLILPTVISNE